MAMGQVLAFSDWLAMTTGLQQDCAHSLMADLTAWTPVVQCLNTFLRDIVFPYPLIYLFITLALKFFILLFLYNIYQAISPRKYSSAQQSILALYSILFIIIAGGGRLLIGGTDLVLLSTIYSGMWAHLVVLVSLYYFVKDRYIASALLIALGVCIHPANVFNVFVILACVAFAKLFTKQEHTTKLSIVLFGLIGLCAILFEYIAAFGVESLKETIIAVVDTQPSRLLEEVGASVSTSEWYDYIYGQDPDDLSLIWLLSSKLGISYIAFLALGTYLAMRVEGTYRLALLLRQLPIAIILISPIFFLVCGLIEFFRVPDFIFEKLIIVQPRRAFFVPVYFLSYYIIRYTFDFFWLSEKTTWRRFFTLLIFYSWFFWTLIITNAQINISTNIIIVGFIVVFSTFTLFFSFSKLGLNQTISRMLKSPFIWGLVGILAIVVKTAPFATVTAYANTRAMFFETTPRTLIDYLRIQADVKHDKSFSDYQKFVDWIKETPDVLHAGIISAGFSEDQAMQLPFITGGGSMLTMNVYRYRGSMHFDKKQFDTFSSYFQKLLGVPLDQLTAHSGVIDNLEQIVAGFDEERFQNMRNASGLAFDYFATRYPIQLNFPVAFHAGDITVYEIIQR
jgi:hypothetical protein